MRVIIIGAGEVGYHVAKTLCRNNDIFIIEKDEEICNRARELDVQVIKGNGADVKLLKSADIDKAELIVAVTGVDEVNIVACMASKLLNNKVKTVARVSNPDYIDRPVSVRETVGMSAMICPELSLASEIHHILSIPEAINVEHFVGGKIKMMEFKVSDHNPLIGKKLSESNLPECCLMAAIFRGSELMIPHGDDIILNNDRVVLVGKPEAVEDTRRLFDEHRKNSGKIAVVGGGEVGYYLVKLLSERNLKLTLIEMNKRRSEEIAQTLPNVLVLNGDGTDVVFMKEENIGSMDAVVAVTDSDEKNLLCSLLAKRLGAKKVIARADRPDYAELFEIVGVDVAISPIQATVNEVLKFTMGIGIESLVTIEGEKGRIIELTAKQGSKIINKKLKDVHFPRGAIISAIVRGGEVIIPDGSHIILPEDKVVIFTLPSALTAVEELFS
ncbi:K+ transport system, NAD-binding component [Candidatus Methanoperedens nitroreducens]|uniref:K+ transport system, NAD-binding component n=1 Tax=Candidatus Methanoperedens nitratireducens TaxID=1392998 RepID=A0A062V7I4_9EURY|nr:Trk system potassium transporter TrkA [Candidatus Methanoperedens nitroreducens]KCZ72503.1 K+ transport system, NAD-binding component [Candidatus Methanoperedens nitroreducens]MDJ1423565.1 Trk system potassium transporter TrkA [Candidatus Methanoperedens sp.]